MRDAARDKSVKQAQASVDDFVAIETSQLGEVARFSNDDLGQHHTVTGADEIAYGRKHQDQEIARRSFIGQRAFGDGRDRGRKRFAHQRFEHRFLAFKVEIDRALGHTGAARDILHTCGGESLIREDGEGRIENLRRTSLFAAAPASGLG